MRSCRPHGGAAQDLAILNYRVRLICPLAQGCSPGPLDPAKRHLQVICLFTPWHKVCHRFWRCVGPCNGSRLLPLRLLLSCKTALRFVASPLWRMVFTALVWSTWPSQCKPGFVPPFGGFLPEGRYRPIFGLHRADDIVATLTRWVTMTGFSPGAGSNPHSIP